MKRRENRRILLGLLAGFLAFYLVMMIIITSIQCSRTYFDTISEISGMLRETGPYLEDCLGNPAFQPPGSVKRIPDYWEPKARKTAAVEAMDRMMESARINGIYLRATAVGLDGVPWLESGNHLLLGTEMPWGYIALDRWLSREQISALLEDLREPYGMREQSLEHYLAVSGWMSREEPEILPVSIRLMEGSREIGSQGTELRRFDFRQEPAQGMVLFSTELIQPYFESGWESVRYPYEIRGRIVTVKAEIPRFTKEAEKRYALCETVSEEGTPRLGEYGGSSLEGSWRGLRAQAEGLWPVRIDDSLSTDTYLRVQCVFYPLEKELSGLLPVWGFSLLAVVLLSAVLYLFLTRLWKKERALEACRRDLTNAAAHDLKTPLGIIRAYSEGLREKIAEDKRDHYLDVVIGETERMDVLVRDLLDLSKLESGAGIHPGACDLAALLRNNAARYEGPGGRKIVLNCPDQFILQADGARMEQILSNLLSNAVRFTPEGGAVYVTLAGSRLTVENEGPPIPQEQLARIWDAFFRGDGARERGGSGLGLAIVKKLAGLHGFACSAENTSRGAAFHVDFKAPPKGKRVP